MTESQENAARAIAVAVRELVLIAEEADLRRVREMLGIALSEVERIERRRGFVH